MSQRWAESRAGDAADRQALVYYLASFLGRLVSFEQGESYQPRTRAALLQHLQRSFAMENCLVKLNDVGRPGVQRGRKSVRILTDDQMAFFQAENALRFDAERSQSEVPACLQ